MRKFTRLALLAIVPLGLFAARLTLRDGTVVNGRFVNGTEDRIVFQDESGVRRTYNINEVQNVDFNETITPARGERNRERADNGRRVWTTLPAGTQLSVRTDESINASTATEGQTYAASIHEDVRDASGNTVIPRGSQANLVINSAS